MKLVSVLVVLALIILPICLQISYIIYQFLKKGYKGTDALWKPSPKFEQFRSQHKVLFYTLFGSCNVLFVGALFWLFYEFFEPKLDISSIGFIWVGSLTVALMVAIGLSTIRQHHRIVGKLPPRPQPGSPDNGLQEWQTRYFNGLADNLPRFFLTTMSIALVIVAIWVTILLIITHYFP